MTINGPGDIDVLERRRSEAALSDSKNSKTMSKNSTSSRGYTKCGNIAVSESELEQFGWYDVTSETVKSLNQTLNKYNIITKDEISHFLAQCAGETWYGQYKKEAAYMDEEKREAYFTSQSYYPYYGAGYIQLTHDYNYKAFAESVGDSKIITEGPQYVADNYAWQAAGWFWSNNHINDAILNGASVDDVSQIVNKYDTEQAFERKRTAYNEIYEILYSKE